MATTTDLSTLKINYLTQSQFDTALSNNQINANEIYLTPSTGGSGGTYSLPLAANGTRGGVQIGYSESGTNYAVKLSSEKMYVSVPWTDTKVSTALINSSTTYYPVLGISGTGAATKYYDPAGLSYNAPTANGITTSTLTIGGPGDNNWGKLVLNTVVSQESVAIIPPHNGGYTYTLPTQSGTIALTSDIGLFPNNKNASNVTLAVGSWQPRSDTQYKYVWQQQWTTSDFKYNTSTTITDTADLSIWLAGSTTSNALTANMNIDGKIYAMGGFEGNLTGTASGNMLARPTSIEFQPSSSSVGNGGFIDFHFNQSTADYTSRIIEIASGRLRIYADNGIALGSAASATGSYSIAEGSTTASGSYSHAEGISTEASGLHAHAEGIATLASGGNSHAEGNQTIACGSHSHAGGHYTIARGEGSFAYGMGPKNYSSASTATLSTVYTNFYNTIFGTSGFYATSPTEYGSSDPRYGTMALGNGSAAFNSSCLAYGKYSFAACCSSIANGERSMAVNCSTQANGARSFTANWGTLADQNDQFAIGKWNASMGSTYCFIIGNGSGYNSRATGYKITFAGSASSGSDRKMKNDITPLTNAKDFIMNLNPVQYRFKSEDEMLGDKSPVHMGFIAQDVAELDDTNKLAIYDREFINPEDKEEYGDILNCDDDNKITWGLTYTEFIAPLVKVVQEQQQEINELRNEIQQLKGDN